MTTPLQQRLHRDLADDALFESARAHARAYAAAVFERNVFPTDNALKALAAFVEDLPQQGGTAGDVLGLLAEIIGYLAGTWLATHYGPAIFPVTAKGIKPMTSLLWWSLLYAPLFSIVASLIPAALAISQDPAHSLRNQE